MSHQPERKEKNCLNCETIVQGRFCHVCGQENIVRHQSFWGLTKHFVYDIFHFDGKFFDTLKKLFFKPGVVAKEYVEGKRMKYLDPIRMYLFTSALFFLIFFSFQTPEFEMLSDKKIMSNKERINEAQDIQKDLDGDASDSLALQQVKLLLDTVNRPSITMSDVFAINPSSFALVKSDDYDTVEEYDSIQKALPAAKRDGWMARRLIHKGFEINNKYKGDNRSLLRNFSEGFFHRMPYLLFVSLPFFAALLKLLYVRRKQFFYSDHAIFTLYHYIFSFLILLLIFIFYDLQKWLHWDVFGYLIFAAIMYWLYHLYKSMRNFYCQNRLRTFSKFLLLNILGFFVILLLFSIFVFFSIFQM